MPASQTCLIPSHRETSPLKTATRHEGVNVRVVGETSAFIPIRDICGNTGIANFARPVGMHGARARSAFTACDRPVQPFEIQRPDRTQQGFKAYEPCCRLGFLQVPVARQRGTVLDGYTEPDMAGRLALAEPAVDIVASASYVSSTSFVFGKLRQQSTTGPVTIIPGSALMNSLGAVLLARKATFSANSPATSAGSPLIGIWRGQVSVGRRPSPASG